jgi:hypothetical protein
MRIFSHSGGALRQVEERGISSVTLLMPGATGRGGRGKVGKTGISFGNFVFLELLRNSGMSQLNNVDSYLRGEDRLWS